MTIIFYNPLTRKISHKKAQQRKTACLFLITSRLISSNLISTYNEYSILDRFLSIYNNYNTVYVYLPLCFSFFFCCLSLYLKSFSSSNFCLLYSFLCITDCSCWSFNACCALVPIPVCDSCLFIALCIRLGFIVQVLIFLHLNM